MGSVVVLVSYRLQPDQVPPATRAIRSLVDTVLARESQCQGITMLQGTDDPTHITLVEHWPSRSHFEGPHMQQPHIQAFLRIAGDFLLGPPDIAFCQAIPTSSAVSTP